MKIDCFPQDQASKKKSEEIESLKTWTILEVVKYNLLGYNHSYKDLCGPKNSETFQLPIKAFESHIDNIQRTKDIMISPATKR